jgi:hypothetical protein
VLVARRTRAVFHTPGALRPPQDARSCKKSRPTIFELQVACLHTREAHRTSSLSTNMVNVLTTTSSSPNLASEKLSRIDSLLERDFADGTNSTALATRGQTATLITLSSIPSSVSSYATWSDEHHVRLGLHVGASIASTAISARTISVLRRKWRIAH